MRCIVCEELSRLLICEQCQNKLLQPTLKTRKLSDSLIVYNFYEYEEIKDFINCKYQFYGDKIFDILGRLAFAKFASNFTFNNQIYSIGIDDALRHNFSQSAILNSHLKSKYIIPIYGKLHAQNKIKYAGKSLEYRKTHKRDFKYTGKPNIQIILVDDIVTTGATLLEAQKKLKQYNCEVLFALTLSDAKI